MTVLKKDVELIGLIGLAHSISHFFHLILVPLFPWIKEEFGLSYSELGLLMTVFYTCSSVVQAISGIWVDRHGARPILFIGMLLLIIGASVLGMANSYTLLLLGIGVAGMGNGVFHPVDYTLMNQLVLPKNLPHAYSIHGITGYAGWAMAPLFLLSLTALFDSWRMAIFGAAVLAFLVLCVLIYRRETINDMKSRQDLEVAPHSLTVLSVLKLPSIWMSWLFFFFTAFSFAGIQSFSSTALVDIYQIPISVTATSYTLFMVSSALGLVAGGFVAAKIAQPDRVITTSFLVSGVMAIIAGVGVFPGWCVPIIFALMGFGSGMAGPARDLMVRAATPPGASGRVFGMVYSGIDLGSATGPILFGLIMDWKNPQMIFYAIAFFQLGAILVASQLNRYNLNYQMSLKPIS